MRLLNIQLEDQIICKIASDKTALVEVVQNLNVSDFVNTDNQQIFAACVSAFKKNEDFSIWTLESKLKDKVISLQTDSLDLGVDLKTGIKKLKECTIRRQIEQISTGIIESAKTAELEEVKEKIGSFFTLESNDKVTMLDTNEQNEYYLKLIDQRKDPASGQAGYPYPFKAVQGATLGAQKGQMILISARPSVGKSAMLENIAFTQSQNDFKVAFFSAEMDKDSILDRQIARMMGIDSKKLKSGDVDFGDLTKALDKRKNFHLLDLGSMTTLDIRAQIHKLKMTSGVDVVFVDYLQKLSGEGKTEYERVSRISRELKSIAMDFKIPMIVACQYNRSADGVQPQLSDLRDSGNIEQDADVVISLWRDKDAKLSEDQKKIQVHLDILKNRNGVTFGGDYMLWFHKEHTAFYEMSVYGEAKSW
jgi:replicative DNA helicase